MAAFAITKSYNPAVMGKFADLLVFTLKSEVELNRDYAKELGVSIEELKQTKMTPITQAYLDFILRVACFEDMGGLIAAYLPCLWCCVDVFSKLKSGEISRKKPIYVKSIDMHTSDKMRENVEWLRHQLDRIAEQKSKEDKERYNWNSLTSCRYEYLFWNIT